MANENLMSIWTSGNASSEKIEEKKQKKKQRQQQQQLVANIDTKEEQDKWSQRNLM